MISPQRRREVVDALRRGTVSGNPLQYSAGFEGGPAESDGQPLVPPFELGVADHWGVKELRDVFTLNGREPEAPAHRRSSIR